MTQYVAIFFPENTGNTGHKIKWATPIIQKTLGGGLLKKQKKLIAGIGQDKKLELVPYQPSRYRSFYVKAVTNPKADKQCPLGCCFSAKLGETL